jgi:hypothetical protein
MPPEESPETKFDRLKKQIQDSILRDYPNPERKGCPNDLVLKDLAERPLDQSVESDPHWYHVTHCSECYREFLKYNSSFRQRVRAQRTRIFWGLAVAAVAIIVAILIGLPKGGWFSNRHQNAELAWVKRSIAITSMERSGNVGEDKPIYLDRLPLELTVALPVGSKAGTYELQLRRNGRTVVSTGANADIQNGTTAFTVRINLSSFEVGNYSMVVRQVPYDWNLYPVVLQ